MKRNFMSITLVAAICCFVLFMSGCNANRNNGNQIGGESVLVPTPTETPTQTPTPIPTPSEDVQPNTPTQPRDGRLVVNANDNTEVRLIVSGQEIVHRGVIIGGEVLVPDFSFVFGQLKDAGGVESAWFWGVSIDDASAGTERAVIFNNSYNVSITNGEYFFTVNDEILPLIVPAQTINGSIHLPLIAIAEAIGATIEWNEPEQSISFFYGGN